MTLVAYAPPPVNTGRRERTDDTGERIGFHRSELLGTTRAMEMPPLPSGNNNMTLHQRRQQHIRPIERDRLEKVIRHGPGYVPGWNRGTPVPTPTPTPTPVPQPIQPVYTPPPAPLPVKPKSRMRARLRKAGEWFVESACYVVGSGALMAGGILITKGVIVLFGAVLGEYFPS